MTKISNPIPNRRRLTILESAMAKREAQVPFSEPFDPVRYIEHTLPKVVRGFDFDYWDEHPDFASRPGRLAFVDFTDGVKLYVRSSVIDEAYHGDFEKRFVISHEIGHIFLHRKKAMQLSRHAIGSSEQYAENKKLEFEANLFGGTLLVPPLGVSPLMNLFEIRRKFQCSQDVAERAKEDAEFWRSQSG